MTIKNAASRAVFRADKMSKADLFSGEQLFAGLNCFEPGQEHALHSHPGQDKLYVVLEGEGEATVGDRTERVAVGAVVAAPDGVPHAMRNPGPARLVVMTVMAPPPRKKS
jgi:quercetin dioxygenase-like cupin family protein